MGLPFDIYFINIETKIEYVLWLFGEPGALHCTSDSSFKQSYMVGSNPLNPSNWPDKIKCMHLEESEKIKVLSSILNPLKWNLNCCFMSEKVYAIMLAIKTRGPMDFKGLSSQMSVKNIVFEQKL